MFSLWHIFTEVHMQVFFIDITGREVFKFLACQKKSLDFILALD